MRTALADQLAAEGADIAPYSGAETARHFGDPRAEFLALAGSCAVYDLGWRAKIRFTGEDRGRWLNGMVTNNVRDLAVNRGNYNFVLNAQGRIQGDLYVYNRGEYLLGDTEASQSEPLRKLLEHFIIMDDVELHDASRELTSIGVQGSQAAAVLERAGIKPDRAEALQVCDVDWNGQKIAVTRMASDDTPTFEIWLAPALAAKMWEALKAAGAKPAGTEALEMFRVRAGIPKYGQDIRDRDLPQETGQLHAVNFTKGCYLGQEIVERIRSRGAVHRVFTGFVSPSFVSPSALRPGAKVVAGGKEVGEITSAESVPGNDGQVKHIALGYIRREAGPPGTAVKVGDGEAIVSTLPFKF